MSDGFLPCQVPGDRGNLEILVAKAIAFIWDHITLFVTPFRRYYLFSAKQLQDRGRDIRHRQSFEGREEPAGSCPD